MKYSVKKFFAWVLTFMMLLSSMPVDALASVVTVRRDNAIIDISDSFQIGDDLVTSRVTSRDGYSVVVTSVDKILPENGEVLFRTKAAKSAKAVVSAAGTERRELGRYEISIVDAMKEEWQPGKGESVDVTVSLPDALEMKKGRKTLSGSSSG